MYIIRFIGYAVVQTPELIFGYMHAVCYFSNYYDYK